MNSDGVKIDNGVCNVLCKVPKGAAEAFGFAEELLRARTGVRHRAGEHGPTAVGDGDGDQLGSPERRAALGGEALGEEPAVDSQALVDPGATPL